MKPRDLRSYAGSTTARLIAGGVLLLFVVGGGLVYTIYGGGALFSAVLCIGVGLLPVVLIVMALALLDAVRARVDRG
jgi:hypothetical protein